MEAMKKVHPAERMAREVMTTNVLVALAEWPLERLAEFFIEHDISGAPVLTEKRRLVGVVTLTDIVRHDSLPQRNAPSAGSSSGYPHDLDVPFDEEDFDDYRVADPDAVTVRDIMTPTLFTVPEDTPLSKVAETMVRGRIHRVFVTRFGRVVGILTTLDLLRAGGVLISPM